MTGNHRTMSSPENVQTEPDPPGSPGRPGPPGGPGRFRRQARYIGAAVAILAGLAVARPLVGLFSPHIYSGTVLQQSASAPPMDGLRYASGDPVDLARFDGEVALVFFGYTNCPDICPMTLSTVARALEQLDSGQRERVNTMMVSVDPDRDDLPSLQQYVGFFDQAFLGVGGPQESIDRAASLYGVYHQSDQDGPDDDSYLIDHTASLMGIGPDGALRIVWAPDTTADALAADLEELLS